MKRIILNIACVAMVCTLMTSCQALKKFFSTDLEEEDFIISQLYADELVDEKPFVPVVKPERRNSNTSATLGVDIENSKLRSAIESWYGTPYLYGGCTKQGVDCSCFVGNVYKSVYGITLKRTANDIYEQSTVVSRNKLKEGDLVFFTNSNQKVSHVGIYLRDDMFVHSSTSQGVIISKLTNTYWSKHFYKGGKIR